MKHIQLLTTLFIFFSSTSDAQKLTFSDLNNFLIFSTNTGSEKLISKGFELDWASQNGLAKHFRFNKGQWSISFDVVEEDPNTENYILVCYGKGFQTDFQTLKSQIMSSGRKLDFFYGEWFKLYFTEYYYKGLYFYFSKGICTDNIENYKNESFFCSSKSLKNGKFTF